MTSERFFQYLPRRILAPLPLPVLQPLLQKIVMGVARRRPEIFDRLTPYKNKNFLIDILNMPFVLLLTPDPEKPRLQACRRALVPDHDARIAGSFLTLLDMIDGRLDGDALFFSRELLIEGNTEAVVALRNALDGLDGNIADEIAAPFGAAAQLALSILRRIREKRHGGK